MINVKNRTAYTDQMLRIVGVPTKIAKLHLKWLVGKDEPFSIGIDRCQMYGATNQMGQPQVPAVKYSWTCQSSMKLNR